jgi:hypothetical protein
MSTVNRNLVPKEFVAADINCIGSIQCSAKGPIISTAVSVSVSQIMYYEQRSTFPITNTLSTNRQKEIPLLLHFTQHVSKSKL